MITKLKNDRILPYNNEAEQYLLGAILLNNTSFEKVGDILKPEHFASDLHKQIYDAISKVILKSEIADPITLKKYIKIPNLDVEKYLINLAESVIDIENIVDYAKIIYDLYIRRQLIEIGENIIKNANNYSLDEMAFEQVETAEKKLFDLASGKIENRLKFS